MASEKTTTMPESPAATPRPPAQRSPAQGGSSDLNHHKVLSSISRTAVLELLRSRSEPLGVVEVAEHVGLHQNTVRSHLDLLVDSGYAIRRTEAPSGPGRPRVVYEATSAPEGDRNYKLLAEVLAQHIVATSDRPGEAAVNAGRSWAGLNARGQHDGDGAGTQVTPPVSAEVAVDVVVRMLGDSGFAPELSADGTSVNLHRCPFRELAVTHQDVVCGAHLGIIQGALDELGGMVSATRLIPFVTPGLCVTTLTRSETPDGS
jgi:predicted ArsR family transcriptional regulator